MYGLYAWLLMKGQIAHLNAKYDTPNFTAVYPEIYQGNKTGAQHVVRYILQTPGVMNLYGVPGVTEFPKNDKIFVFSKIYDTFDVDDDHLMFLPILNLHIFKDNKKKRKKTCYLVGKGEDQHKHPKNAIKIDRQFANDQGALADLLNECHTLYGYDRLTALYDIARLAGCRVQYYGDFSKKDLLKYETGMNGFGYQDEEVKLDTGAFRSHYKGMIKTFSKKIDRFIELTQ